MLMVVRIDGAISSVSESIDASRCARVAARTATRGLVLLELVVAVASVCTVLISSVLNYSLVQAETAVVAASLTA